eukprot:1319662-Pleurochrysis_carterae.AAC.4
MQAFEIWSSLEHQLLVTQFQYLFPQGRCATARRSANADVQCSWTHQVPEHRLAGGLPPQPKPEDGGSDEHLALERLGRVQQRVERDALVAKNEPQVAALVLERVEKASDTRLTAKERAEESLAEAGEHARPREHPLEHELAAARVVGADGAPHLAVRPTLHPTTKTVVVRTLEQLALKRFGKPKRTVSIVAGIAATLTSLSARRQLRGRPRALLFRNISEQQVELVLRKAHLLDLRVLNKRGGYGSHSREQDVRVFAQGDQRSLAVVPSVKSAAAECKTGRLSVAETGSAHSKLPIDHIWQACTPEL